MYRLLQNNVQIYYKDSQCIELGFISSLSPTDCVNGMNQLSPWIAL